MTISPQSERAAAALARAAEIWQRRLADGWEPPAGSPYPWAQVRLSLAALLPGMRTAGEWLGRCWVLGVGGEGSRSAAPNTQHPTPLRTVSLILAGNTPLMSWSPLCACLLAGVGRVRVKMSTVETLWPRLFVEALAEADPETAARVELNVWPGADPRIAELLATSDAVIAYGSDDTLDALRAQTPPGIPFFGFGHAVSVVLLDHADVIGRGPKGTEGLARDILMFAQQGCLSPHVAYGVGFRGVDVAGAAHVLDRYLAEAADELAVGPVRDPALAHAIRSARDVALFAGHTVKGDPELRWTVIAAREPKSPPDPLPYPKPVTGAVFYVSTVLDEEAFTQALSPVRGKVSAVASRWTLDEGWREAAMAAGANRFCKPGEMQTPPLDWPNGDIDLLAELLKAGVRGWNGTSPAYAM